MQNEGSLDDRPPAGKLIQSGIRPESAVSPAHYALAPGTRALEDEPTQLESVECTPEIEPPPTPVEPETMDRRRWLSMGLAGVGAATGIFLLGTWFGQSSSTHHRRTGSRLTESDLKIIESARGWANGPVEVLAKGSSTFLWVIRVVEPDAQLRKGIEQLCEYALMKRGREGSRIAVKLLATFDEVGIPKGLEKYAEPLRDVVWRWQAEQLLEDK